jgi:hypothetical protein
MDARFQGRKAFQLTATQDLTGATGVLGTFRSPHPKIEIISLVLHAVAAFPASATMTTKPVVKLRKTPSGGAIADLNAVALVSPDYSQLINQSVVVDLDANKATSPVRTEAAYPTMTDDDLLSISITTSGVGGTQSAAFSVVYREVEA